MTLDSHKSMSILGPRTKTAWGPQTYLGNQASLTFSARRQVGLAGERQAHMRAGWTGLGRLTSKFIGHSNPWGTQIPAASHMAHLPSSSRHCRAPSAKADQVLGALSAHR